MRFEEISGYENYLIYDDGRVFSKKRNKFLSPRKRGEKRRQYLVVALYDGIGNSKNIPIHRLVAKYFISNPNNKEVVNHKDNDPLNNHVNNLEWVSSSENTQHSYDTTDRGRAYKKVAQLDKKTHEIVATYDSFKQAQEKTGIHYTEISHCVAGRRKSARGYVWRLVAI